ncbi:hypothetical protein U9M48_002400 [Paspalum notatum var. saurae]|uniref:F-box domain-containing protein n=1 Tax=Paspalum notatum var. saurae TaxID=547442 RepID=A0AAQ3SJ14_PASNO
MVPLSLGSSGARKLLEIGQGHVNLLGSANEHTSGYGVCGPWIQFDESMVGGGNDDFISVLPDDALHHILSFLPAEDAVRMCVLARRWRDLWKHADLPDVDDIRKFVNHLLILRKRDSLIYTCDISFCCNLCNSDTDPCLNLWIQHVCGVRHLTTVELAGVALNNRLGNFSNCPNLQHLEIGGSVFSSVDEISSKSLKSLNIRGCSFFDVHTHICTPNLFSLRPDAHFRCSIPVLGSMPSLKKAFVRNNLEDCEDGSCFSCDYRGIPDGYNGNRNKCLLLQGLSEAENLTLMSGYDGFVFHRNLEWCPTFNKLRVLVLDDWFVHRDFYWLNCILKHSPVLEKLTLLFLKGTKHKVRIVGKYNDEERSATISKHLKEIEINCIVVDEIVYNVLKFLGIHLAYISFSSKEEEMCAVDSSTTFSWLSRNANLSLQ